MCYPVSDKSSRSHAESAPGQSTATSRAISLQNLANLLPDLSNNILNLYNRAANITDEPVPQLVFSETVIRLARLQVAVRIRDGALDDNALKHIVVNEPLLPFEQPERPRGHVSLRKSEIANFLFRAMPLAAGTDLPATDSIPIIVGVVSVLNTLDLPRKKAFVLRELLAIIIPTLVQARKIGAAEVGIHPAAGLASLTDTTFDINALDVGPGNMEESMRTLLAAVGEIYGVQPSGFYEWEKRKSSSGAQTCPEYDSVAAVIDRSFRHVILDRYGDLNLKIDLLRSCISCCEALPDFSGVLRFTVELLQTIRGGLMLSETYQPSPYLLPDEQVRLLNNIKRTVGAANKLGASDMEAEYWDDFLVRNVQLLSLPDPRKPVRLSKAQFDNVTAGGESSKKDPFLFNPFSKTNSKSSEMLMVGGEYASFIVTLQNPYEFEVEIEHVRLDSEGVQFDAVVERILLPPLSIQDYEISGMAHGEGTLKITGCFIKVRYCRERRFPIFPSVWKPEPEKKFKHTGLAAKKTALERPQSWSSTSSKDGKQAAKGPDIASCEVKVIGQQPFLNMDSMSLSQSAMMVLEGETRSFEVTLRNTSQCPLDFIIFTFHDSITKQLHSALNNRDLLPVEIHELELKLASKPALRWRREGADPEDSSIPPGQSAKFVVDILGKPGLQDTTIQIDYSCVRSPQGDLPEVFYTRQLFVPITVTVNACIEVARCDVLPFSGDFAWWNERDMDATSTSSQNDGALSLNANSIAGTDNDPFSPLLSQLGHGVYGSDHCILLVDLRNAWPNPLSVLLHASEQPVTSTESLPERNEPGQYGISADLQPGQVTRFVLVLPRVYLDNPHAAIPLLHTVTKRQFVVSAHKLSFEAEAASRETFWYREEILKRVFGSWKENCSGREGTIDMRNIRLNPRMVDAIRLDDVEMTFSLDPSSSSANTNQNQPNPAIVTQTGRSKYIAQTDEMLTLTVTIHNRSSRPIHPLLRLQPSLRHQPSNVALDLSRRLVWTGMLQQVLPILHSGESTQATIGVTVLCQGEYEFGATVEEVRLLKHDAVEQQAEENQNHPHGDAFVKDTFGAEAPRKRRIWHAKEGCVIHAHV